MVLQQQMSPDNYLFDPFLRVLRLTSDLLEIVDHMIAIVEHDEGPDLSVTDSSIWAVCMAYKHYRQADGVILDSDELEYAATRGGIIGMDRSDPEDIRFFTIREYLESHDPGFFMFSHPGTPLPAPPGA